MSIALYWTWCSGVIAGKDLINYGKLYTISKIYIECKDNKKVIYNGSNKD